MVILCQNKRIENGQTSVRCSRFLGDIPQCAVDALKKNPGEKMIFRCATCPSYDRWVSISYGADGKSTWESSGDKPDFSNEMKFDTVFKTEQVA